MRTEGEGQAKGILEVMKDSDAVLVAGGDGTVMEAVTGFMRREDAKKLRTTLPLGVLPVGKRNRLARYFPGCFQQCARYGNTSAFLGHSSLTFPLSSQMWS